LSENPYGSAVDWFDLLQINVIKQWWEIPRDDLTLEDKLGSGAFGIVHKGFLIRSENGQQRGMYCAVKMLKGRAIVKLKDRAQNVREENFTVLHYILSEFSARPSEKAKITFRLLKIWRLCLVYK